MNDQVQLVTSGYLSPLVDAIMTVMSRQCLLADGTTSMCTVPNRSAIATILSCESLHPFRAC